MRSSSYQPSRAQVGGALRFGSGAGRRGKLLGRSRFGLDLTRTERVQELGLAASNRLAGPCGIVAAMLVQGTASLRLRSR